MARLWPRVAEAASAWDGTVIADLGRYQPGHVAAPVAGASTVVLLLAQPDLAGLYHLRDRVGELASVLGDPAQERSPLAVVVRARAGSAGRTAVGQVRQLLQAAGSPVPVAGVFAEDPAGIALLRDGVLTRRLLGSDLVRSAQSLAETVLAWWPQLAGGAGAAAAGQAAGGEPAPAAAGVAGRLGRLRSARRARAVPEVPGAAATGLQSQSELASGRVSG